MIVQEAMEITQALSTALDDLGPFLESCGTEPTPSSLASREMGRIADTGLLDGARDQVNVLIDLSADHVSAFVRTVTEPVNTAAPWTCVRAALEAGALALWLADQNIEPLVRVSRSLALRYEGIVQNAKFLAARGDSQQADRTKEAIPRLEKRALAVGLERQKNKNGKRIGIGQRMPPITSIVALTLSEEPTYRMLSGVAHGHLWAARELSFRSVDADGSTRGRGFLEKNLEPESVAFLCSQAAAAILRPAMAKCAWFGWDVEDLRGIAGSAYRVFSKYAGKPGEA